MTMNSPTDQWSELMLTPDESIKNSQVYQGLLDNLQLELDRAPDQDQLPEHKVFLLSCTGARLQFDVKVSALLSKWDDRHDEYRMADTLTDLDRVLNDPTQNDALRSFLRYSPWLLQKSSLTLDRLQQGVVLARLIQLLLSTIKTHQLTGRVFTDTYLLLLRARFLLLARLYEEDKVGAEEYLPDLPLLLGEAWQEWADKLMEHQRSLYDLLANNGISAEREGLRLLFCNEQASRLWEFIHIKSNHLLAEKIVTQWFLPRYDLQHATMAVQQIEGATKGWRQWLVKSDKWGERLGLALLSVPLAVGTGAQGAKQFQSQMPWLSHGYRLLGTAGNLIWGVVMVTTIIAVLLLWFDGIRPIRFNLPRLTLAIIVGYLALISSGEMMGAALLLYEEHFWLTWGCVLACYLLSYGALYLEVRRMLQSDESKIAHQRVWHLLRLAILRSLWIGWLALVPLGPLLMHDLGSLAKAHPWFGWPCWWSIYPHLLFVFAPLALFFGIFVQTIWEDNSLTHPL